MSVWRASVGSPARGFDGDELRAEGLQLAPRLVDARPPCARIAPCCVRRVGDHTSASPATAISAGVHRPRAGRRGPGGEVPHANKLPSHGTSEASSGSPPPSMAQPGSALATQAGQLLQQRPRRLGPRPARGASIPGRQAERALDLEGQAARLARVAVATPVAQDARRAVAVKQPSNRRRRPARRPRRFHPAPLHDAARAAPPAGPGRSGPGAARRTARPPRTPRSPSAGPRPPGCGPGPRPRPARPLRGPDREGRATADSARTRRAARPREPPAARAARRRRAAGTRSPRGRRRACSRTWASASRTSSGRSTLRSCGDGTSAPSPSGTRANDASRLARSPRAGRAPLTAAASKAIRTGACPRAIRRL